MYSALRTRACYKTIEPAFHLDIEQKGSERVANDRRDIVASFDARAATYAANVWHQRCAERLVERCRLRAGDRVLDAGTGTGFAALAAARAVGSNGRVHGIDLSAGMLREARTAMSTAGVTNVELLEGDATQLQQFEAGTFDAVTCAAGLLYMPVADALREWHRVLKAGGLVAFSTMTAGSPPAARLFRSCAAGFGVALSDPSEPLGSIDACRRALGTAGFEGVDVVSDTVEFTAADLALAWESNIRSATHRDVQRLDPQTLTALQHAYAEAMAREEHQRPSALLQAELLYAMGRRQ